METPLFIHDTDGSVVVDGAVRLTVESFRDIAGYRPLDFGLDGAFKPDLFPFELVVVDASDIGELFAVEGWHPGVHVAVLREDGFESVNGFVAKPTTSAIAAAHRVEAEVAITNAFESQPGCSGRSAQGSRDAAASSRRTLRRRNGKRARNLGH